MPLSEPSVFKGNPLEYALWRNEINSFVDRDGVSAPERIHCLKKYTSGCARECIDGYLSVFTTDSYNAARNMLDSRFGNRFVVTFAFRDKLEQWPKISSNDNQGLQRFSDFLKEVQSNLRILKMFLTTRKRIIRCLKFFRNGWSTNGRIRLQNTKRHTMISSHLLNSLLRLSVRKQSV